jgi:parvulin-like peptidyl-prolyl isomerase
MKNGKAWTGIFLMMFLLGAPPVLAHPSMAEKQLPSAEEDRNAVAARVNGAEIEMRYVNMEANRLVEQMGRAHAGKKAQEGLKSKALDILILRELAYQRSDKNVEPAQVDERIASIKAKQGGDEGYRKFLERESITEKELAGQIERGIILDRMIQKEVFRGITVSEEEAKKRYERDKEQFASPEKVVVVDVVLFLDPGKAESLKKAEEIRGKILAEKEKNPLALASDGSFVARELEVRAENDKEIYEASKKLKVDEISGVITAPDSLHIVKLREYRPATQAPYEQVKTILEMKLQKEARQKKLQEWMAELKSGAKIEIMRNGNAGK